MKYSKIVIPVLVIFFAACSTSSEKKEATDQDVSIEETSEEVTLRLEKLWETDTVLTTCESVIYDPEADVLYVSNINGQPLEKDGNGTISQVDMDGNVVMADWITGLDAPKGMGISNGKLYVTNITELVEANISDGQITNRWEVAEAVFLNDITVDTNGTIYFSDSGTNKVHKLENGEIEDFISGENLNSPNGLFAEDGRIMLATMGGSNFGYIDLTTSEYVVKTDSIGAGDGVAPDGDGHYLVSSWSGEVFHINGDTWEKTSLLRTEPDSIQSADITYVIDKQMLFVPTFFNNKVVAYRLIEE